MARKTKGRQRIDMVKMQNESNLQVTFSKRRSGLFKKASELCTLCATEVALIIFSPGQKVYSFGHPRVRSVLDKYLQATPSPDNDTSQFVETHRAANIHELNKELIRVEYLSENERRRGEILDHKKREIRGKNWWESPIDELNLQQLEHLKKAMEGLKKNIDTEVCKQMIDETNRSTYLLGRHINFGRNDPSSNIRASGTGGFIPFSGTAFGQYRFSPRDVAREIDVPARMNLDTMASGSSSGSSMPSVSNPSHDRQFF